MTGLALVVIVCTLLGGAVSCASSTATDRETMVEILENDGGLSRTESECVYDTIRKQFDEQQVSAIIRASSGKPDAAAQNALPTDLRVAYEATQGQCGIQS